MVPKFSIILQTRKRHYELSRMIDSCISTVSNLKNLEFLIAIDEDDSVPQNLYENKLVRIFKSPKQWSSLRINSSPLQTS